VIDPRVRRPSSPSTEHLARPTAPAKTSVSTAVSEDEVRIHAYQLDERRSPLVVGFRSEDPRITAQQGDGQQVGELAWTACDR